MTVSIWQADGNQPQEEVDFLIIGAGLAGCAAALFASRAGHSVVIVDQADAGMGASGRNAGFMITGLDTYYHRAVERYGADVAREMWTISEQTIAFWKDCIEKSEIPVTFAPIGSLLLAETPTEARDLEEASRALNAAGIAHEYHSRDPLGRGYHAAIAQPNDGAVQPFELVQALLKMSGATLVPNNETYRIRQNDAETVSVYTRKSIYKARYVMMCTNAYSSLLEPYFADKVTPTRAQVLATAPLPGPAINSCGYSDYGYMYYRMTFDNRLLVGGARNLHRKLEDNTIEDRINSYVQNSLEAYMRRRFPDVTAPIERRWAGIMGFSVDGLPMVGTLPGKPRVGFAVGFTGHGLAMAAETVARAVDKLLKGTHAGAVDVERLGA